MKSNTGKRKCEDVEVMTERRITRSITSGKSSSPANQKITISSSVSTEIDHYNNPTQRPIGLDGLAYCRFEYYYLGKADDQNKRHLEHRRILENLQNYYECEMCYKVGSLLCCESCPRVYHLKCLGLEAVPEGHWECPSCCYDFSKPLRYLLRNFNASKESDDEPAAPKLKYSSASSEKD